MIKVLIFLVLAAVVTNADRLNSYLLVDDAYGSYEKADGVKDKDTLTRTIINMDYLMLRGKNKFVISANYTGFNKRSYNNKYKIMIGDFDVLNTTNFYYSRMLTNNFVFTIGIVNYKTPNFNNNTIYNSINGIGIYGLVDFELESCLLTYRTNKFDVTTGTISKGKYTDTAYVLDTNDHTQQSSKLLKAFNGSSGYVLLANYKHNDELTFSFNYYHYNEVLLKVNSKTLDLVGFETKYDRSTTVGDILYGIVSYSNTKGDSTGFKTIDPPAPISNKYYGEYETHGYNILLGYNYTIDEFINKHSLLVGLEYKYSSDGYDSMTIGSPFSLNNGGAIGSTVKAYSIYTINRNFLINVMYANYINGTGKTTMIHGIPLTTKINDRTYGGVKASVFSMGLIYKF